MLSVVLLTASLFVHQLQVEAQTSYTRYCSDDVCFIKPAPTIQKNWDDAQQWCKDLNLTLAIPDNPDRRMKFQEAIEHLTLKEGGVWIGGKATYTDSKNWKWVDGTPYDAPPGLSQQSSFEKSYAFLNQSGSVLAYASPANASYPYMCQYPTSAVACTNSSNQIAFNVDSNCYILYQQPLSWFSARNICLSYGGDLATFRSLPSNSFQIRGSYWVGLRSSWWNWINPTTSESTDVTFTQWQEGQPNDNSPNCISTCEGSDNWRDWDCSRQLNFICQNASRTYITATTTSTASSRNKTPSVSSASSLLTSSTFFAVSAASNATQSGSNVVSLAVGIGVGVGVPLIIAVVVIIIVVVVKRNRRNRELQKNTIKPGSQMSPSTDSPGQSLPVEPLPPASNTKTESSVTEMAHYQPLEIRSAMQNHELYEHLSQPQYEQIMNI